MKSNFNNLVESVINESPALNLGRGVNSSANNPYGTGVSTGASTGAVPTPQAAVTPNTLVPIKSIYELKGQGKAPRVWQEFTVLATAVRANIGEIPSLGSRVATAISGLASGLSNVSSTLSKF